LGTSFSYTERTSGERFNQLDTEPMHLFGHESTIRVTIPIVAKDEEYTDTPLRHIVWIPRHQESGNPSHGRHICGSLRGCHEDLSSTSPGFTGRPRIAVMHPGQPTRAGRVGTPSVQKDISR
jgi:hypothetical protein